MTTPILFGQRRMSLVLPIIGILLGSLVFYNSLRLREKEKQSQAWPTVEGTVVKSEIVYGAEGGDLKFLYEYSLNGMKFKSSRIHWGVGGSFRPPNTDNAEQKYPEGKKVLVFYNPLKPGESVLNPHNEVGSEMWFGCGIVMFLLGVFGSITGYIHNRRVRFNAHIGT